MNTLIADAGSTKTLWVIIDSHGNELMSAATSGFNPAVHPAERLCQSLSDGIGLILSKQVVDRIFYYGAGCLPGRPSELVVDVLRQVWPHAEVSVSSDLLGAARALCGRQPGVACILGTGSNSCLYDGEKIAENTPSLGYILGDEGGGAVLGRNLLRAVFKHCLPEELERRFLEAYNLTQTEVIEQVYRGAVPNRFMASFTPFLSENIAEPAIRQIVADSFSDFVKYNLLRYNRIHSLPVNFIGSVARHFSVVLREVLEAHELQLGQIMDSPMEGLISYHTMG